MTEPEAVSIACRLDDPARARRLEEIERSLIGEATEITPLADGYALVFDPTDERLVTLAAFIAEERHCCPFFHFTLDVQPESELVTLALRGGEGVKAFVEQQYFASGERAEPEGGPALPARLP